MAGSPLTALTRRDTLRLAAAAGVGASLAGPLARTAFAAESGSFDDASNAIPGGLAGEPERVIIVGAGWAGLAAANALRNAGVDYVVLEGHGRIGGRAHTVDLDGVPVDVGCSWIHQPIGNPMSRFAQMAGVRRTNADVELDAAIIRFYDGYLDGEVGLVEKTLAFVHALNFGENEAAAIGRELGVRASVRDGAEVYMNRQHLTGDARRQTAFVIRAFSEFVYGKSWSQLSLSGWAWGNAEFSYTGIGQGDFPVGGYRRLTRAMNGPGEVRLRHRVTGIEVQRGGVVVRATDKRGRRLRFRGSHVVVAVPLGVLKHGSIKFDPPLPPAKREAISNVGFGVIEKVAMVYDEPFWSDLLHTHTIFLSDHAPMEFPWFLSLDRITGAPGLVAFCGGGFARTLRRMRPKQALDLTRTRMAEFLGRPVPRPRAFRVTDWQSDPFSRGSYSNVVVGRTVDDMDALAAPVAGRLLFAGEATNRSRHSTADGAMSSGVREAKRLLRRAEVTLTAG